MSCQINLIDLLTNPDPGGEWRYNGYSNSYISDPLAPGYNNSTNPWSMATAYPGEASNYSIDTDGVPNGFYSFTYRVGEGATCQDEQSVILEVIEGCEYTPGSDKAICEGEALNAFDLATAITGCNMSFSVDTPGGVTWPGSFNTTTGEVSATSGETTDIVPAGDNSITFTFTVTGERSSTPTDTGSEVFQVTDCPNCNDVVETVTVTISEGFDAGEPKFIAACS